jgi:hypothetical protein
MKTLFSIHAGEYLVGSLIEKRFKRVNVWIPLRDTGIDLLVSDRTNDRSLSLQVKFSRDWLVTHMSPLFQKDLRACGWWTISRSKLRSSPADYWVFVLHGFASRSLDCVVVPRLALWRKFQAIHGRANTIRTYMWVTQDKHCWETRGLRRTDQLLIARGSYDKRHRDLTAWLNNWAPVEKLNR